MFPLEINEHIQTQLSDGNNGISVTQKQMNIIWDGTGIAL